VQEVHDAGGKRVRLSIHKGGGGLTFSSSRSVRLIAWGSAGDSPRSVRRFLARDIADEAVSACYYCKLED
jgi:hypothetical protein